MSAARGEIIVFYSYKGGTGRSMALANVGCLLADQSRVDHSVLLVDWDLEAPGLHRFFPEEVAAGDLGTELGLDHRPGLIDLFLRLDAATPSGAPVSEEDAEARAAHALSQIELDRFIVGTRIPNVRLLRAGRNEDGKYGTRVNTFHWERLFERSPLLFRAFVERLATQYRYVLVDSRTGLTDISGICTCLLPEKLVVVFTPNRQSLTGLRSLVEAATKYRRQSDDLRPLVVFPLPSRIEASREDLRAKWRFGDRKQGIEGYQPMFESIFARAYGLAQCSLGAYFEEVQIQQSPDYAYGEELAVLAEHTADRFSVTSSYKVFTEWLQIAPAPWQRDVPNQPLISQRPARDIERRGGTVMFADVAGLTALSERLDPEEVVNIMNRLFSRLDEMITAHGGAVDKYIGDSILAFFVSPSLEDSARYAVEAALEMRARLPESLSEFHANIQLDLQIGINTGLLFGHEATQTAIFGREAKQAFTVMGPTLSAAARLKDAAARGAIWVGPETYRLVREGFEFRKLPRLKLKGTERGLEVYELLSAKRPG
jgi:class 3 adenylate cyclase/cellulose biosynthesis protein BcsQ